MSASRCSVSSARPNTGSSGSPTGVVSVTQRGSSAGGLFALDPPRSPAAGSPNPRQGDSFIFSDEGSEDEEEDFDSNYGDDSYDDDSFEDYCSDDETLWRQRQPDVVSPPVENSTPIEPKSSCQVPAGGSFAVEKLERIGRGSFGDVFIGKLVGTDTTIAIKEIVVSKDNKSRDLVKQLHTLEREIHVMQKLDHENIVKYFGSKRNDNGLSIYMEFADGGTVGDVLRVQGPLSEPEAAAYIRQLLTGLQYLHRRRIVHRDLKGDNLFLTKNGVLKVGDFGTSKELQTIPSNSVAGTPSFMAPEVIECTGHSIEADIWSVGCCAIQMVTGKVPFSALDNQMAVMFAILKGRIVNELPTQCSPELKDFIEVCTRKNPAERWTCKELMHHAWLKKGGWTSETKPKTES